MIKNVLVNLAVEAGRDFVADYGISLAAAFESHIMGVAFARRRESEKSAKAAVERFDEARRRAGLSAQARTFTASLDQASDLFGRLGRRFDMLVVGQAEADKNLFDELIVEAALFDSGRPVIVVPYIHKCGLKLERVLVCWDGSRPAARAVGDAMPLLERARSIEMIVVTLEPMKSDEVPGADLAQTLARHGLDVELRRIGAGGVDVASIILNHASDTSADFIVMGAYGHSRFREFVLGGTTRSMLKQMTVPTLMSH
jgi:nucleotide-binding universal stress UspA family protein